ncbi:UDP-N-acetylmuramoyl-tripeptide-D-alanyl-D-alanine ligase [Enterococcus moraviensis ATCC BAA-383]|uniref:UDP-N-acetylmuramoyl-tripeptide--D-alanyl-D-alanine ligase n=1 Tax=Enterococcus moraviensis ATCC BAA-383 TaxID=1158609 RepID=R2RBL1_9ENTE|nr:UDP-N-acetylmuramoyl-tripeptide--D-alanyl-D-alanine ligase [Enterococcus moraviensis]EOI05006.1 UDP-N-acetylmuramoyl-tripeptide-D-alanyl-D-alanine ligase [Enterococcus moraviensis ATCC BAA-383]EOT63789.1 UDP-N-acetylmuramoylalanyl-D-glutamyl-2, 6-diaminopimelate-D-alanyl-D-alanyl ligase [Enterococcus moraviensis ATCC BAA-383]OJG67079.1 UDP-N-acetylmuramoyl-tripeptide-D-alanyl-D-alanine ligase [Enterococcus moraviensis]
MKLTFWEAAEATKATNDWKQWADFDLTGIEFDSRLITQGNLFVPLKGENDGHSFIKNAMDKEAKAAFWSSAKAAPEQFPVLQVTDTLKAMQDLAVYYLKKMSPTVIAITGSNGKTTTKDMTEAVMAQQFKTYKTQGNYNNDIGLPYTILHMPDDTEKLILEMGMDHANEIDFLSKLAQPDVAAITMIGEAHIENLGSREGIAKAKMEITAGLATKGLLVVPAAEPLLVPLIKDLPQTIKTFGVEQADCQAEIIKVQKDYTAFKINGSDTIFTIPVPGKYNVGNALIAMTIGQWFDLSEEQIKTGLATFQLTKNRTEWLKSRSGIELLSDVYNANPTAMNLVLDSFSQMPTKGKRVAVLGDMLELGPDSAEMHACVNEHLDQNEISEVVLYGTEMKALYDVLLKKYPKNQIHYFNKEEKESLTNTLKSILTPQDMVVLKASNGMGLNEVVTKLLEI